MVTLEDLQKYCKGKTIIIVGNSSRLLNSNNRKIIDDYDIVVRINRGYRHERQFFNDHIGAKTDILSIGVKTSRQAVDIIQGNSVSYILSPIIHSDRLNYHNVYDVDNETYSLLSKALGNTKPSTGISTYNFFNRFIDFTRLDLIGFDFFESSTRRRNPLGHLLVNDHDGIQELNFFETSKDPDKTILHNLNSNTDMPKNNIPHVIAQTVFLKNNNKG
jgi:hypothetical protein